MIVQMLSLGIEELHADATGIGATFLVRMHVWQFTGFAEPERLPDNRLL
mgnify:CR=1 FL=1